MPRPHPHPQQPLLPMDLPLPPLDAPEVLAAARRLFERRPYWQRHYPTLADALAEPQRARLLLICARNALMPRR
jgi:hypothetical protein